tara:strand:+ start:3077 stop:4000 length:924 start_codon:yes stop_codon:yes gene_type:complete
MAGDLSFYLDALAKAPLLAPAEEIELGRQVQAMMQLEGLYGPLSLSERRIIRRGRRAKERFICSNLRLVFSVANPLREACIHCDVLDLVQEGTIGLSRAVELFDPERGYKFSTYAYWWIRQAMYRFLAKNARLINLPQSMSPKIRKIRDFAAKATRFKFETGDLEELAHVAGFVDSKGQPKVEDLRICLSHISGCMSTDEKCGDDKSNGSIIDLVGCGDYVDHAEEVERFDLLQSLLSRLPELEQTVLAHRFGLGTPQLRQKDTADVLGMKIPAISHTEHKALERMRGMAKWDELKRVHKKMARSSD